METASENRGRGRPPVFPDEILEVAGTSGNTKTRRGQQEHAYAGIVISDLVRRYAGDERIDWLIGEHNAKWSLLAELGRIKLQRGEDALWEAADWLVENKPKVKHGVALLRAFRTGTTPQGSVDGLYEVLRRAINDYRTMHWGITTGEVEVVLMMLLDTVRDSRD